ncbi:MAG: hypothetical protein K2H96_01130 [Muribaculaceae bacterium]|nr:hypothetical protein [Muribaculaceae bacterium]
MKKTFTIALALTSLLITSCDKEPVNNTTETVATYNYVARVNLDDTTEPVIKKGYYHFGLDNVNGTVSISTDMVDLGDDQDTGFTTESFKFTSALVFGFSDDLETHQYIIHGFDQFPCTATNGMQVTDLRFELSPILYTPPSINYEKDPTSALPQPDLTYKERPKGYAPKIRYVLGNEYKVYTFWPDLYYCGVTDTEVLGDPESAFKNQDVGYRIKFDISKKKAQVVLYNVKFNQQMPEQKYLILPDLDVQFTHNGYIIEASNVNPLYIEGNKLMENPRFPFTTFKFVAEDNMVEAYCDFTVAGRFHGYFTGKYMEFVVR